MPEVILPCPACCSTDCECLICTINADEKQDIHFHMVCNKCFTSGPITDDAESARQTWNAIPRMSAIITWQFQAAGAALENQRLRAALHACPCAIQHKRGFSTRKDEPELVDALEKARASIV